MTTTPSVKGLDEPDIGYGAHAQRQFGVTAVCLRPINQHVNARRTQELRGQFLIARFRRRSRSRRTLLPCEGDQDLDFARRLRRGLD